MAKKMNRLVLLIGGLGVAMTCAGGTTNQTATPARDALRAGLAEARANSRDTFLLYGFPACQPCKLFKAFLAEPSVSNALHDEFVLVEVDTERMADGAALQAEYGPPGAPAWAIIDAAGTKISDSDDGAGNVGFPTSPRGRAQFRKALRTARPDMPDKKLALLDERLREFVAKLPTFERAHTPSAIHNLDQSPFVDSGTTNFRPAASRPPQSPGVGDDDGLKTMSLLNGPEGVQNEADQAQLLGVALMTSAQNTLIGTWTNKEFSIEIFTEGTPPKTRIRLPSVGAVRLHLLWDVKGTTGGASAFAVARNVTFTQTFTFRLRGEALSCQQITIFTDNSGRPNQIADLDLFRAAQRKSRE